MEYAFASGGRSAHPRSRGENGRTSRPSFPVAGSSPLTRGKRRRCPECDRRAGLIPAHAGKTTTADLRQQEKAAHPRSRGENRARTPWCAAWPGSSPLTRGKLSSVRRPSPRIGLIPAHAGKTCLAALEDAALKAHPRSRGENDPPANPGMPLVGSSPLTRGKRDNDVSGRRQARLIPAHAGKTWVSCLGMARFWAHPRSRGENTS